MQPTDRNPADSALTVLDGDQMSADDAAWAMIADAVEGALTLPGLSAASALELADLRTAALRCARLPVAPPQQGFAG